MGTHQAICTAPHCTAICSAVYHRLLCCLYRRSALKDFLTYILASFLVSWAQDLKGLEFQELIMFLQKPPTSSWSEKDIELVLSRAHMWRASFKGASSHFA